VEDTSLRRAVLLSGPRRVGKTTILQQIACALVRDGHDPKSVLYLSLDHPILRIVSLRRILDVYHQSIRSENQRAFLLLDEVQYQQDWDLEIKQLIDHRDEYRILATGSASLAHNQRLVDSGVGRWLRVGIPTLSFYEFLRIRRDDTSSIPDNVRPIDLFSMDTAALLDLARRFRAVMPLFQRYLLVGGFPETATHHDIAFCQRLLREDVVERVLKRDITALFAVRNVADLEKIFIYLCLHSGGILSISACASALGTSAITVANHLEILEQANLIYRLQPWRLGGKKVLKVRHKVYLVDAALRNAVLLRGEEILQNPGEMGTIVETTVLRHLYAYYYRDTPEFFYWRDPTSGREVDIIVRSPAYLIPVEIKYRQNATLDDKQAIHEFCRSEKPEAAYWVIQRDQGFSVRRSPGSATRILAVPAHIFVYLLGQAERLLWEGVLNPEASQ